MKTSIALTVTALAMTLLPVTGVQATDGGTAIDMCKKLAGCVYDVGAHGDILILTDSGHIISCPSLSGECEVTSRPENVGTSPTGGIGYQPPQGPNQSSDGQNAVPAGNAYQPPQTITGSGSAAPVSGPIL
jgi:hypothetical protein